jgi:putative protease
MDAGADVVYAGLKGWSLRPDMFEAGWDEICRIISLAGERNRRVFLAFNCFYRSGELEKALELIEQLTERGASGVILSEMGLVRLVRSRLPGLPVHVSVQASASSAADIDYYRHMGVSGVVLPRDPSDLSISNIKELTGRGVAVEVFALGDNSVNYDGRCALSAYFFQKKAPDPFGREVLVIGNANRCGYCFLACKRKCAIEGKEGSLLARGDLVLYRQVPALVEAGVEMFKIQGREFPLPLVKKLVSTFRRLLDNRQDPAEVERCSREIDALVGLKQEIAANHLWLLARSRSPFWKGVRPFIEKPWDALTAALRMAGIGRRNKND